MHVTEKGIPIFHFACQGCGKILDSPFLGGPQTPHPSPIKTGDTCNGPYIEISAQDYDKYFNNVIRDYADEASHYLNEALFALAERDEESAIDHLNQAIRIIEHEVRELKERNTNDNTSKRKT